jgi:hypothetical protein
MNAQHVAAASEDLLGPHSRIHPHTRMLFFPRSQMLTSFFIANEIVGILAQ